MDTYTDTPFSHNISENFSKAFEHSNDDETHYIMAVKILRNVYIPVIATIGLIGNTMSLLVFSARSMKESSCSVFLASLAFVDNIFLISLLITWIDGEFYDILVNDFTCQVIIFITYVTSFLSVWFIVGFTCERFFAICFPLRSSYICSVFREKVTVVALTFIACLVYNFSFWTITVQKIGSRPRCMYKFKYMEFLEVATWVDTIVTMIVPFVTIALVNTKVLHTAIKFSSRRQSTVNLTIKRLCRNTIQNCKYETFKLKKDNPHLRVTRTLLLVSTTFLFLNLPSHVIRLYNLIIATNSSRSNFSLSMKFFFIQEVASMLYYTTFSCNFVLYTLFGRNFKSSLRAILLCKSTMDEHRQRMLRRLSSTQGNILVTSGL